MEALETVDGIEMKQPQPSIRREAGVALLLTLGLLSLLLVMVMAFAFNARVEYQAAQVNTDIVRSRLLTESAIQRAFAQLQYVAARDADADSTYFEAGTERESIHPPLVSGLFTTYGADTRVPAQTPRVIDHAFTLMHSSLSLAQLPSDATVLAERTATDDVALVFGDFEFFDPDTWNYTGSGPRIDWIPILDNDRLVGRFAYVLLDDTCKVDPSSVEGSGDATRPGQDISELRIASLDSNFTNYSGDMGAAGRAFSWNHARQEMLGDDEDDARAASRIFRLAFQPEVISAKYMMHQYDLRRLENADSAAADTALNTELVDELVGSNGIPWLANWTANPAGTSDTCGTWPGDGSLSQQDQCAKQIAANLVDYIDSDPTAANGSVPTTDFNGSDYPSYVGIEKVACINDIRINVANTSTVDEDPDGNPGSGDETWAIQLTVTGNMELVFPFLSDGNTVAEAQGATAEMQVTVSYVVEDSTATTEALATRPDFAAISATPEDHQPGGAEYSAMDQFESTVTLTWAAAETLSTGAPYGAGNGYVILAGDKAQAVTPSLPPADQPGRTTGVTTGNVSDVRVRIDHVYLVSADGELLDCARAGHAPLVDTDTYDPATDDELDWFSPMVPTDHSLYTIKPLTAGDSLPDDLCYYAETNDPRQNHNPRDWQWRTMQIGATTDYSPPFESTHYESVSQTDPAGKNTICDPHLAGGDPNDANGDNDAADLDDQDLMNAGVNMNSPTAVGSLPASAYIRNGYPEHLSELGIIHRASAWRTLNLTRYNRVNTGGGYYYRGDRNIVDHVCLWDNPLSGGANTDLTPPYLVRSKINPNADYTDSDEPQYRTIFNELCAVLCGNAANPPGAGAAMGSGSLTALASAVRNASQSTPFAGPNDMADRWGTLMYALDDLNDRQKEVLLLHTADLQSATYSYFTGVVVAQAIQDIDVPQVDPTGNGGSDTTDDNGDESGRGVYDSAASISHFAVGNSVPAPDVILGEQKILFHCVRNNLKPKAEDFTDAKSGASFNYVGRFEGHDYYLSDAGTETTWVEAERICRGLGGHLACVGSQAEDDFLFGTGTDIRTAGASVWVGLYRVGARDSTADFEWVSGEEFDDSGDHENWASGQPDLGSAETGPACTSSVVMVDSANWNWTASANSASLRYVLEVEANPIRIVDYQYLED